MAKKVNILNKFKERLESNPIFSPKSIVNIYNNSTNKSDLETKYNDSQNKTLNIIGESVGLITGTTTTSNFISSTIGKNNIIGKALTNNVLNGVINQSSKNLINLIPGGGFFSSQDQQVAELDMSSILKNEIPPFSPIDWDKNNEHYINPTPAPTSNTGGPGILEYTLKAAKSIAITSGKNILIGLSNGKGINNLGLNNLFDTSVNSISKIYYARKGLKYTQAIGMFDNSSTIFSGWSNKVYYNKYLSELNADGQTYTDTINIKDVSTSPLVMRYTQGNNPDVVKGSWDTIQWSTITNPKVDDLIEKRYGFAEYAGKSFNGITIRKPMSEIPLGKDYDNNNKDLIKFRFEDITSGKDTILIFRATFSGLKDSVDPDWNSTKYIGRANQFYNYVGFSRSISFSFVVDAHNQDMRIPLLDKINKLMGMCYPAKYSGGNITTPPIVKLTIGDIYNKIIGKFSNISISPDDNSLWETDEGIQMPHVFNIDVSFDIMQEDSLNNTLPYINSRHIYNRIKNYINSDKTSAGINTSKGINTLEISMPDSVAAKGFDYISSGHPPTTTFKQPEPIYPPIPNTTFNNNSNTNNWLDIQKKAVEGTLANEPIYGSNERLVYINDYQKAMKVGIKQDNEFKK